LLLPGSHSGNYLVLRPVCTMQDNAKNSIPNSLLKRRDAWQMPGTTRPPEVVSNLYSAVERMRLVSSGSVVKCAEEVMRGVIAAYTEPNRSFDELRQRVQQRSEEYDELRAFTNACRQELSH